MKVLITDELELNEGFDFKIVESSCVVRVLFTDENGKKHSREFIFNNNMTPQEVEDLITSKYWSKHGFMLASDLKKRSDIINNTKKTTPSSIGSRLEEKKSLWQRFLTFVKRLWKK